MTKSWQISRRTMLRGVGVAMALPFLDVMGPATLRAAAAAKPVVRLGYLYFPNGSASGSWKPQQVGESGELKQLNALMKPLEACKGDMVIPSRVWTPEGNGHGAGTATWLTGGEYDERRIDAGGVSVDQLAARHLGKHTMLPSLELSMRGQGNFSKDLSRNNISWRAKAIPSSREIEPRVIFDRMFLNSSAAVANRSALDRVREHARQLRRNVSMADQRKLDEYLEAVRAIEKRIEFADRQSNRAEKNAALQKSLKRPAAGIPQDHGQYMRLMMDLMVMAFWADATRVCTFMLDHGQSNRYFNFIEGVKGTWHALSHWKDINGRTEDDDGKTSWSSRNSKKTMYNLVTTWHHEQFAYLIRRMKQIDDGGRPLLDNVVMLYGSSIADGHEHNAKDLPLLIAGKGGGVIKSGRVLTGQRDTTLCNLHLSMLRMAGVKINKFGDSRGELSGLV